MQVLQFWSDAHPDTPVDVFVYHPFDFETEYERAFASELPGGAEVRVVSLPALLAMKQQANRAQDNADIEELRRIHDRSEE
ncbi:MAG TPA: hypothetical protein VMH77_04520 [Steroidobacteraceae bacterium]|nr:hypothetical protein [Steroidobacteraceae bacterium]